MCLGPIEVAEDGRLIKVRPAKQRRLLAALALEAGGARAWKVLREQASRVRRRVIDARVRVEQDDSLVGVPGVERPSFAATSAGLPGVERDFTSFSSALQQVQDAHIYAGFHFRFSVVDGATLGTNVGNYITRTLMQPLHGNEVGQLGG